MSIVAVSKRAGVSIATVSRVINNHSSVAPATAEAVRLAALEVGYAPTPRQRKFRAGATRLQSVSLVFPDPSAVAMKTVLSGRLSHGISLELAKNDVSFVVSSLPTWDRMPACVEKRTVDGVIIRGTVPVEQLLPQVRPLPCVTVFETVRRPSYGDQILDDSSAIGEMAADYLIEHGCRHLACLSRDPLHPAYAARRDAFARAVQSTGEQATVISAAIPYNELIDRLLAVSPRPTGVFVAGEDRDASGVYTALAQRGIQIGTQLRLITTAYDPLRILTLDPSLDYIDIAPEAIGSAAVRMMLWRVENPDEPQQRHLVPPVLVRAQTNE